MRVCYGVCMCRGVHNCAYNIHIIYCAGVCVVVRSVHVCLLGCVYMGCVCVCVCVGMCIIQVILAGDGFGTTVSAFIIFFWQIHVLIHIII